MSSDWRWGWEAGPPDGGNDDLPGDPPKRSRPIDVQVEVNKTMARIAVRDQMAPLLRYRQTTEDEEWLNQLGISGATEPPGS